MKVVRLLGLFLLMSLISGCNEQSQSHPTRNSASNNASVNMSKSGDAYGGLAGPWEDFQGTTKGTNEYGFVVGESIDETKAKAEEGNAVAQLMLGWSYVTGNGVPQNSAEATKWIRKGIEQNPAVTQPALALSYLVLGFHYLYGMGVSRDYSEAVKWLRKGADLENASAQLCLGDCYFAGWGVPPDPVEAANLYSKSAVQGLADAQCKLGVCWQTGKGRPKDSVEAVKWFRKASDQGHADAQGALAGIYAGGNGVKKNSVEAMKWARRGAEQGSAYAQLVLGAGYADGDGLPRNDSEAYKWLTLAAAQNLPEEARANVVAWLNSLEARMSRGEIVEAQQLAAVFTPRKESQNSAKSTGLFDDIIAGQITRPNASGTGFFISEDGSVISNSHVVKGASQIRLVTSAGLISAKVVKVDAANDLALLKAEGQFAALPITASRGVRLGGTVATVGFPNIGLQGFAPKLAKGEIASLSGAQDDARYFQISVPVQPGNSGGALVDERGNVVGVVSARLSDSAALRASGSLPQNVNYAVKSSYLLSFLESVPEVAAKLKAPESKERKFEEVVKSAERAAVLVLVY